MRDRLIELLKGAENKVAEELSRPLALEEWLGIYADHLIANGVILPPCKIGDKTFLLLERTRGGYDIVESECVCIAQNKYTKVYSMAIDCVEIGNTLEYHLGDFGRWVFFTKEEAEKALRRKEV